MTTTHVVITLNFADLKLLMTELVLNDSRVKRIHVHQHNLKKGKLDKIFTVKHGGKTYWAGSVEVLGPATFVQSVDKPLSCGAKIWSETRSTIVLTITD